MLNKYTFTLLAAGILTSSAVLAKISNDHIVIAPHCLIENLNMANNTIAKEKQFALLKVNAAGINKLIAAKHQQLYPCGGFMDVTHEYQANVNAKQFIKSHTVFTDTESMKQHTEYSIKYETQVNQLLKQLNPQAMWGNLKTLTEFKDRYANSTYGVKAAEWIKSQVETMAKNSGHNDVTVSIVSTGNATSPDYKQPSVVAKIGTSTKSGVVIGAHMDTLNSSLDDSNDMNLSVKPGADDDGSGSAVVLEIARTLLQSGMTFDKPIYLVWYAAEEEGLVGSRYVVADFVKNKTPVTGVMQFDMTGFAYQNEPTMYVMDGSRDGIDKNLTAFVETLIKTYPKQPVKHSQCGYACSDQASWKSKGFASAIAAEAAFENTNPAMHSSQDTMDKLSLSHMTDYAKLGVAFAVELADPVA